MDDDLIVDRRRLDVLCLRPQARVRLHRARCLRQRSCGPEAGAPGDVRSRRLGGRRHREHPRRTGSRSSESFRALAPPTSRANPCGFRCSVRRIDASMLTAATSKTRLWPKRRSCEVVGCDVRPSSWEVDRVMAGQKTHCYFRLPEHKGTLAQGVPTFDSNAGSGDKTLEGVFGARRPQPHMRGASCACARSRPRSYRFE